MTIAALRTTVAILAVFVVLTITFALLTAGAFSGASAVSHLGGYFGLLSALLAWYASFAGGTNATFRRAVVPVIPLAR